MDSDHEIPGVRDRPTTILPPIGVCRLPVLKNVILGSIGRMWYGVWGMGRQRCDRPKGYIT